MVRGWGLGAGFILLFCIVGGRACQIDHRPIFILDPKDGDSSFTEEFALLPFGLVQQVVSPREPRALNCNPEPRILKPEPSF